MSAMAVKSRVDRGANIVVANTSEKPDRTVASIATPRARLSWPIGYASLSLA